MAGGTPHAAVRNYLDPLNRALSCVTVAVLNVSGYDPGEIPHALTLNRGNPVQLAGNARLSLSVIQHYQIVEYKGQRGPWKVTIVAYLYALEDSSGLEVLAYHWHPKTTNSFPHLHLGQGAKVGRRKLADAHLPTGRIAIEDVLRLAITEFGVKPRRKDWADILDATQAAYETWRTWSGSGTQPSADFDGPFFFLLPLLV